MTEWYWANENSRLFMSRGYLQEGETIESRSRHIADTAQNYLNIEGFADKFYSYLAKGYYSLSSPVWANYGRTRGLPISCNGSYIEDSMTDILYKQAEVGMMTKHGAGTSIYLGGLRPSGTPISSGGYADGPNSFARLFETVIDVVSQGNVRRGNLAAYLDIEHPDVEEFLRFRESGHPIQKLSIGVTITDEWMEDMIKGDDKKQDLWLKVLEKRINEGYPYIIFIDSMNNNKPQWFKDKELMIRASNLCTEIALPSDEDDSFVCCLMSMNLAKFNEWVDTDAVETAIYFLDTVITEYVDKTKDIPFMDNPRLSAFMHRALGLGVLGYHTALQQEGIPFESFEAMNKNVLWHKTIRERAENATEELATLFGESDTTQGYGVRNSTLMAIAPTTSSSFILGQVSPGIEPWTGNAFTMDLQKGKFTHRNPVLLELLQELGKDTYDVWASIIERDGSVQHLDFLTDHQKEVFKTASEISQLVIVQQAASRQKFIDQAQSLNLWIHPKEELKEINKLYIEAWDLGVKSLYYQHSINPAQELARNLNVCVACES